MNLMSQRLFAFILLGFLATGMTKHVNVGAADDAPKPNETAEKDLAEQLVGTWRLEKASTPGSPSGVGTRLKLFTGTHWCIIQPDAETGVLVFHHGGRYEADDNEVKTTRDFAGESTKSMIGGNKILTNRIDNDTMQQMDSDGVFNETWKRVK
ncbi:hypothetical protein RBSH_06131 [Rhodopirellula baltica SH28]|uniref:Lipocalin-like domain-containing protein n=2 Tax=Rhodopirellula baltica TaxID=265606 RepID=K5D7X0_RHOBT|nr:hypothetical protein RBSH_06131 [Rhodopirellula baltica SH28]